MCVAVGLGGHNAEHPRMQQQTVDAGLHEAISEQAQEASTIHMHHAYTHIYIYMNVYVYVYINAYIYMIPARGPQIVFYVLCFDSEPEDTRGYL